MKIVYIAGPYRASTGVEVRANIQRAQDVQAQLLRLGFAPICPHTMTAQFEYLFPDIEDTAYLDSDLEFLRRSDAVLMLPGWEKSEGSCQERLEALADIIPVYFSIEELQARETEVAS